MSRTVVYVKDYNDFRYVFYRDKTYRVYTKGGTCISVLKEWKKVEKADGHTYFAYRTKKDEKSPHPILHVFSTWMRMSSPSFSRILLEVSKIIETEEEIEKMLLGKT